jgi:hypothetical protein
MAIKPNLYDYPSWHNGFHRKFENVQLENEYYQHAIATGYSKDIDRIRDFVEKTLATTKSQSIKTRQYLRDNVYAALNSLMELHYRTCAVKEMLSCRVTNCNLKNEEFWSCCELVVEQERKLADGTAAMWNAVQHRFQRHLQGNSKFEYMYFGIAYIYLDVRNVNHGCKDLFSAAIDILQGNYGHPAGLPVGKLAPYFRGADMDRIVKDIDRMFETYPRNNVNGNKQKQTKQTKQTKQMMLIARMNSSLRKCHKAVADSANHCRDVFEMAKLHILVYKIKEVAPLIEYAISFTQIKNIEYFVKFCENDVFKKFIALQENIQSACSDISGYKIEFELDYHPFNSDLLRREFVDFDYDNEMLDLAIQCSKGHISLPKGQMIFQVIEERKQVIAEQERARIINIIRRECLFFDVNTEGYHQSVKELSVDYWQETEYCMQYDRRLDVFCEAVKKDREKSIKPLFENFCRDLIADLSRLKQQAQEKRLKHARELRARIMKTYKHAMAKKANK